MRLIRELFRSRREPERRERPPDHADFWYGTPVRGRGGPDEVMGIGAVYACVQVLTKSAAVLPLLVYKRKGSDRERASKHPLSRILALRPNGYMTHFQWVEHMFSHVLLRGNAYSQVVRNRRGDVTQLLPIHPDRITPKLNLETGRLEYEYRYGTEVRMFPARQMLHLKGLTEDGLIGISPVTKARLEFEVMQLLSDQSATWFRNNSVPPIALKHPQQISEDTHRRMRRSWQEMQSGSNYGKVAILEQGLSIEKIGLTAQDAQFADQIRLSLQSAARMFGLPPHKIGELSRATFSNIEQQSIDYVIYSLLPWLKSMEESLMFTLLTEDEDEEYFIEYLVDGLMRGDFKTRQEGLAIQRQNGIISANEWRKLENLNAFEEETGDKVLVNGNMISVKSISDEIPQEPASNGGLTGENDPETAPKAPKPALKLVPKAQKRTFDGHFNHPLYPLEQHRREAALACFRDKIGRALTKERNALEREKSRPDAAEREKRFLDDHREHVKTVLEPDVRFCVAVMDGGNNPHLMEQYTERTLGRISDEYMASREPYDYERRLELLPVKALEALDQLIEEHVCP